MKLGPDGSLCKITSTVKEPSKVMIIPLPHDSQNPSSSLYKLAFIDSEKGLHESSSSEESENETNNIVIKLSDIIQEVQKKSDDTNNKMHLKEGKEQALPSKCESNNHTQSSCEKKNKYWFHNKSNRHGEVHGKRKFKKDYNKLGNTSKNFNASTNINPWLTRDAILNISHSCNQISNFPLYPTTNDPFTPLQPTPDILKTGLLGHSPFSRLPPNFPTINQPIHGNQSFYYDKPTIPAQSVMTDQRCWIDMPMAKQNVHPEQPYWNNEPTQNQNVIPKNTFWNNESLANMNVANDQKYWNKEAMNTEPAFWSEGHSNVYPRPSHPDRDTHIEVVNKDKYSYHRFHSWRRRKNTRRRWSRNQPNNQGRKQEWRQMEY